MHLEPKTAAEARYFLKRVADGRFDQESLASFIIATRELAQRQSVTREIGDFIAHPIRDKGLVLEHLSRFTLQQNNRREIRIAIPAPSKSAALVSDLCRLVKAMGLDDAPLQAKADELTVCYFGILHLAKLQAANQRGYFLKISPHFHRDRLEQKFLSLISVSTAGTRLPVYTSEISASKYLGALEIDDSDLQTVLRATRVGSDLKLIPE